MRRLKFNSERWQQVKIGIERMPQAISVGEIASPRLKRPPRRSALGSLRNLVGEGPE